MDTGAIEHGKEVARRYAVELAAWFAAGGKYTTEVNPMD